MVDAHEDDEHERSGKNFSFLFNIFGVPQCVISDRGTCFTSQDFDKFVSKCNIKHVKVAVASPWANGQVKRVNRFIKSTLAKTIDNPLNWKAKLNDVQYILNNTHNESINTTLSNLLLGYNQRKHIDKDLCELIDALTKIETDILEKRAAMRDSAQIANRTMQEYIRRIMIRNKKSHRYIKREIW